MPEFNLLGAPPKIMRDVGERMRNKDRNRPLALKYDFEYFDGTRDQGYGGYHYDGRWVQVAKTIVERYGLKSGDRILDVGCAKGFLMKDIVDVLPGLEVWGLDVSQYAIEHCHPDVTGRMLRGSCDSLPFANAVFQAVVAVNVIHNLDRRGVVQALREIERVGSPGCAFVQIDAYRNDDELEIFEAWMLTARTYCKPHEWEAIFHEANYTGDYFWTILECDPHTIKP